MGVGRGQEDEDVRSGTLSMLLAGRKMTSQMDISLTAISTLSMAMTLPHSSSSARCTSPDLSRSHTSIRSDLAITSD